MFFSNHISAKAEIGSRTEFYHYGLGCVVHPDTIIGEDCVIFQNVTIGSKWKDGKCEGASPKIGNRVMIGAGAVLLGDVYIGDDVIVGANAVVICNVPDGHIALGVPAIIKER